METLFLSYTYHPHPDHEGDLERLRKTACRAIEAMGLRIIDGVDVGGRPLDAVLQERIEESDCLVALMTPQADAAGAVVEPRFVFDEFQYARGQKKPTMKVLHSLLLNRGLGASGEYTSYQPGNELIVVVKLMNTIALWIREHGRRARVRLEPDAVAARYDENEGDRCECQVIGRAGGFGKYGPVPVALDPGAAFAVLPKLRDGDRVRLRVTRRGRVWETRYAIDPFVGGVSLEERT
jgi:hypothetical protein